jgi:hypothetical protein
MAMKLTRSTAARPPMSPSPQMNASQNHSEMMQQSNLDTMHAQAHKQHVQQCKNCEAAGRVPFVSQPRGPDTQSY